MYLMAYLIDSEAVSALEMLHRYWTMDQNQHGHIIKADLNTWIPIQSLLTSHHAVQEHCL